MYNNTVIISYSVFVIFVIMKVSVSEKILRLDYPGHQKTSSNNCLQSEEKQTPTVTRLSSYFSALTKQPGELSSGSNFFRELTASVTIGQSVNCGV